jgi:DNA-binding response OmpR family regulator
MTTHTVLIADDEPSMLVTLEFLMQREGYHVLLAHDGDEALAQLRAHRPDIVLLDVMMPGKTGFEVCQAVRADEALARTKVLLLSAKGRDIDIAQGLGVGADSYMTKPFSTRELAARVRGLLVP